MNNDLQKIKIKLKNNITLSGYERDISYLHEKWKNAPNKPPSQGILYPKRKIKQKKN